MLVHACVCVCVFSNDLEETDTLANRYMFHGFLLAFVDSLYGRRPGVVINMFLERVEAAKESGIQEEGYILNLSGPSLSLPLCVHGASELLLTFSLSFLSLSPSGG